MKRWESLVDGYLRECELRGLARSTLYNRQQELGKLGFWLRKRRPRPSLESVDADLLVSYLKSRCAFLSKCTLASVMSETRSFGEYLVAQGVWTKNPLRWMEGPKLDPRSHLPRRATREQLLAVFTEAAKSREQYHRHLMLAALSVLYSTGIRRGELERLTLEKYDMASCTLRIDGHKSGVERTVPIPPSAVQCIEAYLPHRFNLLCKVGRPSEQSLFVGKTGLPIRGDKMSTAVARLAKRAKVPHVTLHQFRHSCASDLLEEGVGLAHVQRILGHAFVVTTFRYTQIADPERKAAMTRHPLNEILTDVVVSEALHA